MRNTFDAIDSPALRRTIRLVILGANLALSLRGVIGAQTTYTITDLGTLGGLAADARGINAAGQVTGFSFLSFVFDRRAFLYSGGVMTALPTLGGDYSSGNAISGASPPHVVGRSSLPSSPGHAFLYRDGVMRDLGTLGGDQSDATAVNAAGDVVGWSKTSGELETHAMLYRGGSLTDLGTLGGPNSVANGINAAGAIVGHSFRADLSVHAFLYTGGVMMDLGTLGGLYSNATAINDVGGIVGYSRNADEREHAFLYSGGVMMDLGTLGGRSSQATAINSQGQIVGRAHDTFDAWRAFLYSQGAMVDLNTRISPGSGWLLQEATGTNDTGHIVGYGVTADGFQHAFLLTPSFLEITFLTVSPSLPQPFGTTITWTATATGGTPPLQYRFWRYNSATGVQTLVQDYSTNNTYTWTPGSADIGNHRIVVWARSAGSISPHDTSFLGPAFSITGAAPTITALTPSPSPPQPFGIPIAWTVTATGGVPPLQYRFWRYNSATGAQVLVQDYSTSSSHTWTPASSDVGQYQIIAWARSAGSPAPYDAWFLGPPFTITP